jgi:hypothetical protein
MGQTVNFIPVDRSQEFTTLTYAFMTPVLPASCRGVEFQCFMKIVVKLPPIFNKVV